MTRLCYVEVLKPCFYFHHVRKSISEDVSVIIVIRSQTTITLNG